jgi:hypothetical protein
LVYALLDGASCLDDIQKDWGQSFHYLPLYLYDFLSLSVIRMADSNLKRNNILTYFMYLYDFFCYMLFKWRNIL